MHWLKNWYLRRKALRLNERREVLLRRARHLGLPMPDLEIPLMPDRKKKNHD